MSAGDLVVQQPPAMLLSADEPNPNSVTPHQPTGMLSASSSMMMTLNRLNTTEPLQLDSGVVVELDDDDDNVIDDDEVDNNGDHIGDHVAQRSAPDDHMAEELTCAFAAVVGAADEDGDGDASVG